MVDSKGVIHSERTDLTKEKKEFACKTDARTLADAFKDADVFLGLSKPGIVTKEMIQSMAKNPIIFALANPVPEIFPEDIQAVRDDAIIGTGRSDYANQVNNVLGFPSIFRGALDVRATKITERMKMAAARALANLAREPVSSEICALLGVQQLAFGKEYVIPNPFDRRVLTHVATAVAQAAFDEGVARVAEFDAAKYCKRLRYTLQ